MSMLSNDQLKLQPRTDFAGPTLTFDFPELRIGVAEYEEGPTGCTVFHFPEAVATAVDVRGGLVGMTDAYDYSDAICLAGGSLMGLEAVSGVAAGIFAQREYVPDRGMPLVNGAIIYDYRRRDNAIYPDKALGRAALEAAKPNRFLLGARGAGRSAGVGAVFERARSEASGQGGAYREIGQTKLAIFTVVNALGVVVERNGAIVRGNLDRLTGERTDPIVDLEARIATGRPTDLPRGNTTLTVLITNQKLDHASLTQLGRQVHSSMARAILPFHTVRDGDVLYTATTGGIEGTVGVTALGLLASELAWDAVLAAVR